jgi:hypothetical protein
MGSQATAYAGVRLYAHRCSVGWCHMRSFATLAVLPPSRGRRSDCCLPGPSPRLSMAPVPLLAAACLNSTSSAYQPTRSTIIPGRGALQGERHSKCRRRRTQFFRSRRSHVSTTTEHALPAALGLRSRKILMLTRHRSQHRLQNGPYGRVDACDARRRCVIHLQLLWWSAGGMTSALIGLGQPNTQAR